MAKQTNSFEARNSQQTARHVSDVGYTTIAAFKSESSSGMPRQQLFIRIPIPPHVPNSKKKDQRPKAIGQLFPGPTDPDLKFHLGDNDKGDNYGHDIAKQFKVQATGFDMVRGNVKQPTLPKSKKTLSGPNYKL